MDLYTAAYHTLQEENKYDAFMSKVHLYAEAGKCVFDTPWGKHWDCSAFKK